MVKRIFNEYKYVLKGREKKWNNNNKWKLYVVVFFLFAKLSLSTIRYYLESLTKDDVCAMPLYALTYFIVLNESLPLCVTHHFVCYALSYCILPSYHQSLAVESEREREKTTTWISCNKANWVELIEHISESEWNECLGKKAWLTNNKTYEKHVRSRTHIVWGTSTRGRKIIWKQTTKTTNQIF